MTESKNRWEFLRNVSTGVLLSGFLIMLWDGNPKQLGLILALAGSTPFLIDGARDISTGVRNLRNWIRPK